jgi:hypothetical protein
MGKGRNKKGPIIKFHAPQSNPFESCISRLEKKGKQQKRESNMTEVVIFIAV